MQSHYNIKPSDDGLSYTFTTKNDIVYKLALVTYPIGEISAFSLSVYPDEGYNPAPGLDLKIKNTVAKIIGDILAKDSNTLFYVCDSIDGNEDKRHRAFEYWYEKCKKDYPYVEKVNHHFITEDYQINSSLLYNSENPLANDIIRWFKEAMSLM